MRKFTTGNKDLDWMIFEELSDQDILNLCLTNKEMSKLCDDDKFWEYRLKKKFKHEEPTFKQKYQKKVETIPQTKPLFWFFYTNEKSEIVNVVPSKIKNDDTSTSNSPNSPKRGDIAVMKESKNANDNTLYILTNISKEGSAKMETIRIDENNIVILPKVMERYVNGRLKLYIDLFMENIESEGNGDYKIQFK